MKQVLQLTMKSVAAVSLCVLAACAAVNPPPADIAPQRVNSYPEVLFIFVQFTSSLPLSNVLVYIVCSCSR